jgi:hypothetical protein
MPLNQSALSSGLQSCFANPPGGYSACAQAWADAVQSWCSSIVPPSTTVAAAAATLSGQLAGAFAAPDAVPAMESAFSAFAAAVGLGMAGYVPTPPAGPVGFGPYFAGPDASTHAQAASDIAGLIDPWMRSGVATLIAPPNTVLPWS